MNRTGEVVFRSIDELVRMLRKKEISSVELAEAFLDRIESTNAASLAYITVARESALRAAGQSAKRFSKNSWKSDLDGIPFGCKDMFATRGIRTTGGSRVLRDWVPDRDAEAVARLSAAGGVLLGKTNQHEFAYGATGVNEHFGTVPNPWDPGRLAGGSSGGSASAVAIGAAAFALGTDTGGSTRVPAALCGVTGFKPTYGVVSVKGAIPFCWSLDHVGIFARTAGDAAMVYHALAKRERRVADPENAWRRPTDEHELRALKNLRIGIPRRFFFEQIDREIDAAVKRTIEACERHGAIPVEIDMPPMEKTRTVSLLVQLPEALSYHSRYFAEKKHLYGEDVRAGLAAGQFILAEHYVRAKRMMQWLRDKMKAPFEQADVVATPTCPVVAPQIGSDFVECDGRKEPAGNAVTRFTSFFNLTGHPAISIPCGFHSSGLPMGVQLVGRCFEDEKLLKIADAVEKCPRGANGTYGPRPAI